jgi:hypothetical protein
MNILKGRPTPKLIIHFYWVVLIIPILGIHSMRRAEKATFWVEYAW